MEASFPEAWGEANVTTRDSNTWKDNMGWGVVQSDGITY